MEQNDPSPYVVSLRMRKLVLDQLELIADRDGQLHCHTVAPHVCMSSELFNLWDDVFTRDAEWMKDVFTEGQVRLLIEFDTTLQRVSDRTPRILPPFDEFVDSAPWLVIFEAARATLDALRQLAPRDTPA